MTLILVLNGPNLGRLGRREPAIYGHLTLAELERQCTERAAARGMTLSCRQTDDEAELIGWLHEAADGGLPVVLNPAAFTHYSYALRDAVAQRTGPLVEVHISNPHAREEFRHTSVISGVASAVIAGAGIGSYLLAIDAIAEGHVS
ncbi:MAG: type II 3-dehydroquinate dehydratase [Candidatus Nanopelagicales bacterium]